MCAAIWRPKIFGTRAMAVPVFSRRLRPSAKLALERPSAPPQRTGQAARVDAELGRQAWPSARFVTKARGAKPLQNRDPVPWQPWAGALFNLSKRPRPGDRAGTIAEWA